MRTVQPRNVHTAVAEALAEVPATVRQIRARILDGE